MNNVPAPKIGPNFAIEDIHKIREWHYDKRKGMTPQEISEDTRKGADRFIALMYSVADLSVQEKVNRSLQSVRTGGRQ